MFKSMPPEADICASKEHSISSLYQPSSHCSFQHGHVPLKHRTYIRPAINQAKNLYLHAHAGHKLCLNQSRNIPFHQNCTFCLHATGLLTILSMQWGQGIQAATFCLAGASAGSGSFPEYTPPTVLPVTPGRSPDPSRRP